MTQTVTLEAAGASNPQDADTRSVAALLFNYTRWSDSVFEVGLCSVSVAQYTQEHREDKPLKSQRKCYYLVCTNI